MAVLKHVELENCRLDLTNFTGSSWEGCSVRECGFRESFFSEVRFRKVRFEKSDLSKTDFFRTSLKDIDFSDSVIEGITVSEEHRELQGMKVNMFQAAELVKLLGVKVI